MSRPQMSRWLLRAAWVVGAAGAGALGLAGQAYAAPAQGDLEAAVQRDLGISYDQFVARGAQADKATQIDERLRDEPGYRGVSLAGEQIVVSGEGAKVRQVARDNGARTETDGRPAATAEPMLQTYLREVGPDGLVQLSVSETGWTLVVDDPTRPRSPRPGAQASTPQQFAERHPGVRVERGRPASPRGEVLGGQGWYGPTSSGSVLCSVGFAAFDRTGRQEVVSAGHCTHDGAVTQARTEADRRELGSLRMGEFGGPNYSSKNYENPGGDVSVYGSPASGVDPIAKVESYSDRSPAKVTGTVAPVQGAPLCTAGRTSRQWKCGRITEVGAFSVQGTRFRTDPGDVRIIKGFHTDVVTLGGDSGGSMISGTKAVGVLSAGNDNESMGSLLDPVWAAGRTLEVWLESPVVSTGGAPGSTITGRVPVENRDSLPAGTKVRLSVDGTERMLDVAGDGTFRFIAPAVGSSVRLQAVNGFSTSAWASWSNTGAVRVIGAIGDRWRELGGGSSPLGDPVGNESCTLPGGGCFQDFVGGRMVWSPRTGAQPLWGAIVDAYRASGAEAGPLGLPTERERCGLRGGGCLQRFQYATMYFSPATGTHWTRGAIQDRWGTLSWENGPLGYPRTDERCGLVGGGCLQDFQGGSVYWSPATGAQVVWGAIYSYWGTTGWEWGRLGYPVAGESCDSRGCRQAFQRGTITWSPAAGARG